MRKRKVFPLESQFALKETWNVNKSINTIDIFHTLFLLLSLTLNKTDHRLDTNQITALFPLAEENHDNNSSSSTQVRIV